jgi:anti-sigma B factor antagonist
VPPVRVRRDVNETASITRAGGIVTVTLRGDADYSVVTTLLDTFGEARALPGVRRIIVDLAAVRFMDSAGLGAFVAGFRFARQDGLTFEVVNPSPGVEKLLTMTGVTHVLAASDDDQEDRTALSDYRGPS